MQNNNVVNEHVNALPKNKAESATFAAASIQSTSEANTIMTPPTEKDPVIPIRPRKFIKAKVIEKTQDKSEP